MSTDPHISPPCGASDSVLAMFLVERRDQSLLSDIEQLGIDQLVPTLAVTEVAGKSPAEIPALPDWMSQMQQTLCVLMERVDAWQGAMQASTIFSAGQTEELHRLGRTLLRMSESEERLVRLQEQLNQNLQTLQVVETLERTANSLNAAVSVLTAKTALKIVA